MSSLMPKTQFGRYSGGLLLAFVLFFALFEIFVMSGQRGGDTFFDNLWLSIPAFIAFLSAIFSMIIGIVSVIRDHERSPIVFIACIIGLLIAIFLLGEFISPH